MQININTNRLLIHISKHHSLTLLLNDMTEHKPFIEKYYLSSLWKPYSAMQRKNKNKKLLQKKQKEIHKKEKKPYI